MFQEKVLDVERSKDRGMKNYKLIWIEKGLLGIYNGSASKKSNKIYLNEDLLQCNSGFRQRYINHEIQHLETVSLWQDIKLDTKDFFRGYLDLGDIKGHWELQKIALRNSKGEKLRGFIYVLFQALLTFLQILLFPFRAFLFFRLALIKDKDKNKEQ